MRVFDSKVAAFLGIALVLAALTIALTRAFYDLGENVALAAFAVSVGCLAVRAPGLLGSPLPKEVVDFWYYLLVMCSVVAFYISNDNERARLRLASEQRQAKVDHDALVSSRMTTKRVVSEPNAVLDAVRKRAQSTSEMLISQRDHHCRCAHAMSNCFGQLSTSRSDRDAVSEQRRQMAQTQQTAAALLCAEYTNEELQESWKALASIASLSALAGREWGALGDKHGQSFGSAATTEVIRDLAAIHRDPRALDTKVAALDTSILEREEEMKKRDKDFESLGGIGGKRDLTAATLAGLLWPYLLISLLGLKIARVDYLK